MSIVIQLHNGRSLISRLIKWQTRSPVSHASVWFPWDHTVIESIEGVGVRKMDGERYRADFDAGRIHRYNVNGMTVEQAHKVREFMESEVGAKYDYGSVFKFVTRRKARHNTRWFCSELVFAACQEAGVTLLANIEAWAVSPGDLAKSPMLERIR